ncbi:MAG TPA: ABC transporter substrate-binding protein [Ktedonosporobacter sp.]|nr:ABC transporter substrate-binding protein [Ktedonosporobacter sp.]
MPAILCLTAHRKRKTTAVFVGFLVICALLLSACSGNNSTTPTSGPKADTLESLAAVGDDFVNNYNPNAVVTIFPETTLIYDTLLDVNAPDNSVKPWLVQTWEWSGDNKVLTFHLRPNVKWADGQLLTSKDVAFTINLVKKYPQADYFGIWQKLTSLTIVDDATIQFTLNTPFYELLPWLGSYNIEPEHIYSKIQGDPTKYIDDHPVGTGPYMLESFTPNLVTFVANPNFWEPGKPAVKRIKFHVYKNTDTAQLQLFAGKLDVATMQPSSNIDKNFVQKDSQHNHYWFVPGNVLILSTNVTKKPLSDVAVRQAISQALDRDKMSKIAELGYMPVASPTLLLLPNYKDYLAPQYADLKYSQDIQKAQSTLEAAGYTKGSDGIYVGKDGQKLSFQINVDSSAGDRVTIGQMMVESLKSVGMDVSLNTLPSQTWDDKMRLGDYDTAVTQINGGVSPFDFYNFLLNWKYSGPIGTKVEGSTVNFERWNDPTTNQLLDQFLGTSDLAAQKQLIYKYEQIMVEQVPSVPLLYQASWFEYRTAKFTGWPSADNQYTVGGSEQMYTDIVPA